MKPLIVLLVAFVISLIVLYFIKDQYLSALAGCIAMSVMMVFTAMGHFIYTKGMVMMVPDAVPFKTTLVYATGIFEIAAAIGLQLASFRQLTGWALIVFFLLMLPANISAAVKHVDYQKATYNGSGINYLWFRVPLQIVFIAWVYFFCVYVPGQS